MHIYVFWFSISLSEREIQIQNWRMKMSHLSDFASLMFLTQRFLVAVLCVTSQPYLAPRLFITYMIPWANWLAKLCTGA